MAVKIRLSRHGSKKRPFYRIVVADSRAPRDGSKIEEVGRYDPMVDPYYVSIDLEKVDKWIAEGAEPTATVARLIDSVRNPQDHTESKQKPSKKAAAKAAAAETAE